MHASAAALLAALPAALLAAACTGDEPSCPSELVLQISEPPAGAQLGPEDDTRPDPGIQIDVVVQSSLHAGDRVSLAVNGAQVPDPAEVDDLGRAVFAAVTLPPGTAQLAVRSLGECGAAGDAVAVTVFGAAPAVTLRVAVPASAACGRDLSAADDADVAAGVQVIVQVGAPGAVDRAVEVNGGPALSTDALGRVTATLSEGENVLVGVAHDALGQEGRSAPCALRLR